MLKLTFKIGFWTSCSLVFLGIAYMVILAGVASADGLTTMDPTEPRALWAGLDTLFTAAGMVVLMACIMQNAAPEKKILGTISLSFTILFAAVVCINRFTQLTVIRQSFLIGNFAGLDRFLPYGEGSVFFALEMLGWGVFMSLAALFSAPLFTTGRLERWIAAAFTTYGVLGLTSAIGFAMNSPIVMVGFLAWGPVLGVAVTLLGFYFLRASHLENQSIQVILSS